METYRTKKLVVAFDLLSLVCGVFGISLGILSILALQQFWPANNQHTRETNSFVITCVCLFFDSCSAIFALLSFIFGKKIYKTINLDAIDPVESRLNKHEKKSYEFDKTSFVISIIGLCLGIGSLLTITPWSFKWLSIGLTIAAIIFDFLSVVMIICALDQYNKYQNVKSIVKLAIESIVMNKTKALKK